LGLERLYYDFYFECKYVADFIKEYHREDYTIFPDLGLGCEYSNTFEEAKKRKSVIKMKQMLLKDMFQFGGMNKDEYRKLANGWKYKKNETDFSQYKVGEEVVYINKINTSHDPIVPSDYIVGVISKVNKASITFKPYKLVYKDYSQYIVQKDYEGYHKRRIFNYDKNNFEKPKNVRINFHPKDRFNDGRFLGWTEHSWETTVDRTSLNLKISFVITT